MGEETANPKPDVDPALVTTPLSTINVSDALATPDR
jgi:hypothetical protein